MSCNLCGKEFIQLQNRQRTRCNACNTKVRRLKNKLRAIEYLGGKCVRCGFSGHPAALEFHHLRDKSYMIGSVANKSWNSIVGELDKCELICSNCHRIEHSNRYDALVAQK